MKRSHDKDLSPDPQRPFVTGIEYYRPPTPRPEFWDGDLATIAAAGMTIARTFYSWDWSWPEPDRFDFSDLDELMDTAARHGLKFWIDTPLGTHMTCPIWMIRQHPDMRAERQDGSIQRPTSAGASPHGAMTHNFDHPMWRVYAEQYLREIVPRYKDHPAMGIWGTWDGIGFAAAWSGGGGYPPYNDYTIARYRDWLKASYTLDELNERLLRRYASWEQVEAPRSNKAPAEMLLYRRFHYENMADHLGWMADLVDQLDGCHEQRSHGTSYPEPRDEICSPVIDSWGLSHHSADRLTSSDPYSVACECFGFLSCRTMGRNNRWWNEEIYSSFVGGIAPREKRTIPEESTMFLWLTLIEGGAGGLYWQYRPEYMTFEAPGLSVMAADGRPSPRWGAIETAIGQIGQISAHLPVIIDPADIAIAYSAPSSEIFTFGGQENSFVYEQRGLYRTLWKHSIPQDMVTPGMDWSQYKLVYLPNFALLDDIAVARLRGVLQDDAGPAIVADGHFGTFDGKGHWSFEPPEGLGDLLDVRVVDFDMINDHDVATAANVLRTEFGEYPVAAPCQYLILEPQGGMKPIAHIGDDVVGVQSADGRFTWYGISLCCTDATAVSGQPMTDQKTTGVVHPDVALPLVSRHGIAPVCRFAGDRLVAYRRGSQLGGSLLFLLNVERRTARTTVTPEWPVTAVTDLLTEAELPVNAGAFEITLEFGDVRVLHCSDS